MTLKALITDDSQLVRKILGDILRENNFEILEAESAEEAIHHYKKQKPDLVIMDIMLGGKNGIEAVHEITSYDKSAIVIMCTSIIGQEQIIQKTFDFGASEYITKPFKKDEIRKLVAKYLPKILSSQKA